MNVTAKDKGTGKEQSITITNSGNMSKEDIEKAQKEAELHADEDKKRREAADARNILENKVYQFEKMPDEYKDKISDEDKDTIKKACDAAKEVLKDETANKEKLEEATKDLDNRIMPIGAKLYQSASTENANPSESNSDNKKSEDDSDAVEGEVVK